MIEKMRHYYKLTFPTGDSAQLASNALMSFITDDPRNALAMIGPHRIVMWEEGVMGPRMKTLYVSEGGLSVLRRLRLQVPEPEKIEAKDLPKDRALMLGDASDWNE
jgi:hypothetical protein